MGVKGPIPAAPTFLAQVETESLWAEAMQVTNLAEAPSPPVLPQSTDFSSNEYDQRPSCGELSILFPSSAILVILVFEL